MMDGKTILTSQEIINAGAALYDNGRLTRAGIKTWLTKLNDSGRTKGYTAEELSQLFDLICG